MLTDMGFGVSRTAAAIEAGVGTLSGGWRMKVSDRSIAAPYTYILGDMLGNAHWF